MGLEGVFFSMILVKNRTCIEADGLKSIPSIRSLTISEILYFWLKMLSQLLMYLTAVASE